MLDIKRYSVKARVFIYTKRYSFFVFLQHNSMVCACAAQHIY